ncbi:hypothetical protein ACFQ1I_36075 [Kitasatospora arboriphila]
MTLRTALSQPARWYSLAAGGLPVLAFPGASQAWLAWVALVPGMLLMRAAPGGREAAVRGWWFGAGFILVAMYWLVPSIGPALLPLAVVFGALQAAFGFAVHRLLHGRVGPRRAAAALVVVPSVWVACEFARSWHALGGPWALLGASQWEHPAVLVLASVGGVWLVSAVVVACNTAVVVLVAGPLRVLRRPWSRGAWRPGRCCSRCCRRPRRAAARRWRWCSPGRRPTTPRGWRRAPGSPAVWWASRWTWWCGASPAPRPTWTGTPPCWPVCGRCRRRPVRSCWSARTRARRTGGSPRTRCW